METPMLSTTMYLPSQSGIERLVSVKIIVDNLTRHEVLIFSVYQDLLPAR